MPYAFVHDIAATWQQYELIACGLVEPLPPGLVVFVAGPTEEGLRTVSVWVAEPEFKRFRSERLLPAMAAFGDSSVSELRSRDLHGGHLVLGSNTARTVPAAIRDLTPAPRPLRKPNT